MKQIPNFISPYMIQEEGDLGFHDDAIFRPFYEKILYFWC